jgi:hypothetical protein
MFCLNCRMVSAARSLLDCQLLITAMFYLKLVRQKMISRYCVKVILITMFDMYHQTFCRTYLLHCIQQQLQQCLVGREHPSLEWDTPCSIQREGYLFHSHICILYAPDLVIFLTLYALPVSGNASISSASGSICSTYIPATSISAAGIFTACKSFEPL